MSISSTRSGIVLIDKPQGLTSHDVVARMRRIAATRKVGHAGTLDPMATGLLVLGVNSSTRLLTYVVGLDKEYEATIRLGSATTTDDAEGETISTSDDALVRALDEQTVDRELAALTGDVLQTPSSVSAIKVDGKRAYARVRGGETVVLDARPVTIAGIDVLGRALATDALGSAVLDLSVRVTCSSGTYIRAIARDLGDALGTGGHLTALRRTRIGPFRLEQAHTLESVDAARDLLAPASVASTLFPAVTLDAQQSVDLRNGKRVALDASTLPAAPAPIAATDPDGVLIGLVELRGGSTRVLVNFPTDAAPQPDTAPRADQPNASAPQPVITKEGSTL